MNDLLPQTRPQEINSPPAATKKPFEHNDHECRTNGLSLPFDRRRTSRIVQRRRFSPSLPLRSASTVRSNSLGQYTPHFKSTYTGRQIPQSRIQSHGGFPETSKTHHFGPNPLSQPFKPSLHVLEVEDDLKMQPQSSEIPAGKINHLQPSPGTFDFDQKPETSKTPHQPSMTPATAKACVFMHGQNPAVRQEAVHIAKNIQKIFSSDDAPFDVLGKSPESRILAIAVEIAVCQHLVWPLPSCDDIPAIAVPLKRCQSTPSLGMTSHLTTAGVSPSFSGGMTTSCDLSTQESAAPNRSTPISHIIQRPNEQSHNPMAPTSSYHGQDFVTTAERAQKTVDDESESFQLVIDRKPRSMADRWQEITVIGHPPAPPVGAKRNTKMKVISVVKPKSKPLPGTKSPSK